MGGLMFAQCIGEFFGTMVLILLGNGAVANVLLVKSKGYHGGWMAIATGWCVAVIIGVFVAQSAGSADADINPAVTLAKYWLHLHSLDTALLFMIAQFSGAFVGAILVWLTYLPHWVETEDPVVKLMAFSTVPAIRRYSCNLLSEVIASMVLIIGLAAIFGKATSGNPVNGLGPYLVGMLVWGIGLSLGGSTGYAVNPARDLGPRLAHALLPIAKKGDSDWSYAWIPVLGPFIGASLAAYIGSIVFL
jgi:glycerol uptake facilitator protein